MTRQEFIDSLNEIEIKEEVVEIITEVYQMELPVILLKILSKYPIPELFDENESRTLSIDEIINAEEDNEVPFKSNLLFPIVDKGNNDYIVFDGRTNLWCIYNIIDELLFDETTSFEELFLN